MVVIHHGTVEDGQIVLPEALELPDSTEVTVSVEVAEKPPEAMSTEEWLSLPFFGMWADREEMRDSVAWVRKQREAWTERLERRD